MKLSTSLIRAENIAVHEEKASAVWPPLPLRWQQLLAAIPMQDTVLSWALRPDSPPSVGEYTFYWL